MDGLDEELRQSLASFERIFIGFSGGLDSCVLLHKLSQDPTIFTKLRAVHVHHGLSSYADQWVAFTEKFSQSLNIPFKSYAVTFNKAANIEEAARDARYKIFTSLLKNDEDVLVLAHHQNDQAETLLMHLFRGAGIDGLASMPAWRTLGKGKLYRPLISFSRQELEKYAKDNQLIWIEDESNQNLNFNRNFLRHEIIPELQKRWPGLTQNLCRTAQHCASAKQFIHTEMDKILKLSMDEQQRLSIESLLSYPRDTQCFLLREWLAYQHFKLPTQDKITRILDELVMAKKDASPIVSWKKGRVRRYQGWLYALPFDYNPAKKYEKALQKELTVLKSQDPEGNFEVKYRQGGEKLHLRGQTHELKKLFQEWKIPPWEREYIPLIYKDNILLKVLHL